LSFYTQWTNFMAGNMFATTCDYVSKLIPPHLFEHRLEQAVQQVLLLQLTDQIQLDRLPRSIVTGYVGTFGLDRFSDEFWIASHPDVRPCHGDPTGLLAAAVSRTNENVARLAILQGSATSWTSCTHPGAGSNDPASAVASGPPPTRVHLSGGTIDQMVRFVWTSAIGRFLGVDLVSGWRLVVRCGLSLVRRPLRK